jgi:hypothetical protein
MPISHSAISLRLMGNPFVDSGGEVDGLMRPRGKGGQSVSAASVR